MAPTKQAARKKPLAKKANSKKQVTLTTPTKPAIRHSFESAPNLGDDIHLIWVGTPSKLFLTHSALFPPKALAVLNNSIYQPYPGAPMWCHTVDTTVETFEIYRNWLYTEKGKLFCHDAEGDQDYADDDGEAHEDREWVRLAHAYLLGVKLGDEKFCNMVVDGLVEKMAQTDRYPTGLANDVYNHTDHGDKLRALLVDLHVWGGQGKWISPPHDDANGPPYFCRAVRRGVKDAGSALYDDDVPLPWEANLCQYHTHETTAPCEGSEGNSTLAGDIEQPELALSPTPRRSPRTSSMPGMHKKVCEPQVSKRR